MLRAKHADRHRRATIFRSERLSVHVAGWGISLIAQTPALLLSTLVYAFLISFMRYTDDFLHPYHIPLIWLGFAALVLVNPLPMMLKPSRFWLLRELGILVRSATLIYRVDVSSHTKCDRRTLTLNPCSSPISGWGENTFLRLA